MTFANLTNLFHVFNIKNCLEHRKTPQNRSDYAVFRGMPDYLDAGWKACFPCHFMSLAAPETLRAS